MSYNVLLYYLYTPIADPDEWAKKHRKDCEELELKGRIIVAEEGINGTVSGSKKNTEEYQKLLNNDPVFKGIEFKSELSEEDVFPKLSIKVRDEIVSLGLDQDIDPNQVTGKRLDPKDFRKLMEDSDAVLLDGRNDYESDLGRFEGAICPDISNFREFPDWLEINKEQLEGKKVLTYCTGGIRCEKLSGLLVREGLEDVYQLHGGIIKYGQDPEVKGDLYEGDCYVFDQRVRTEINSTPSAKIISKCSKCDTPSPRYKNCAWPPCNKQFFLCEPCEKEKGMYCSIECKEQGPKSASRC